MLQLKKKDSIAYDCSKKGKIKAISEGIIKYGNS